MTADRSYYLGLELGSTRIKAVVIDAMGNLIESASKSWKSEQVDGYWSYSLQDVDNGVDEVLSNLKTDLKQIKTMGVSAMMHGYLAFDKDDNLLVPFRTWQNTTTSKAADELSELFGYNIPERWSIAHLYQAIIDREEHISQIAYITTLAGYVHKRLTGVNCLGIGDASGMFPVDTNSKQYNAKFMSQFDELLKENGLPYTLADILPEIKIAGEIARDGESGELSAKLSGVKFCPPEGDAGTGMIATNAIKPATGNVSAGTSVFAMLVLESPLKSYYKEIDVVTTPLGDEVAMVHANNCTLDLNAWVSLFGEVLNLMGVDVDNNDLYMKLFMKALTGSKSGGGLINYPFVTGEQITNIKHGMPTFIREENAEFTLANFMRTQLMSCVSALKLGFNILRDRENVQIKQILGHGGFFNTPKVGQEIMAAGLECTVGVMDTANEGGAWGMAVLAAYADTKASNPQQSLQDYLDFNIFKNTTVNLISPSTADIDGFNEYLEKFTKKIENVHNQL